MTRGKENPPERNVAWLNVTELGWIDLCLQMACSGGGREDDGWVGFEVSE